jgi:hypothetical protein
MIAAAPSLPAVPVESSVARRAQELLEAHKLSVYVAATDLPVWEIDGTSTQAFQDPVTYGVVPAGVTEVHAAEALQRGTRYGVRLVRYHETTADSIVGTVTFTP